ncbi:MAG: ATP-binding protein [Thermotaleaceae bacterium]
MSGFQIKETNRIELKRELNDKLEKEVVGFLNYHEGGTIYIGIDDDGNMIGLENVDDVQLKVKDRIKNNIMPSTLGLFDVYVKQTMARAILKSI